MDGFEIAKKATQGRARAKQAGQGIPRLLDQEVGGACMKGIFFLFATLAVELLESSCFRYRTYISILIH